MATRIEYTLPQGASQYATRIARERMHAAATAFGTVGGTVENARGTLGTCYTFALHERTNAPSVLPLLAALARAERDIARRTGIDADDIAALAFDD